MGQGCPVLGRKILGGGQWGLSAREWNQCGIMTLPVGNCPAAVDKPP